MFFRRGPRGNSSTVRFAIPGDRAASAVRPAKSAEVNTLPTLVSEAEFELASRSASSGERGWAKPERPQRPHPRRIPFARTQARRSKSSGSLGPSPTAFPEARLPRSSTDSKIVVRCGGRSDENEEDGSWRQGPHSARELSRPSQSRPVGGGKAEEVRAACAVDHVQANKGVALQPHTPPAPRNVHFFPGPAGSPEHAGDFRRSAPTRKGRIIRKKNSRPPSVAGGPTSTNVPSPETRTPLAAHGAGGHKELRGAAQDPHPISSQPHPLDLDQMEVPRECVSEEYTVDGSTARSIATSMEFESSSGSGSCSGSLPATIASDVESSMERDTFKEEGEGNWLKSLEHSDRKHQAKSQQNKTDTLLENGTCIGETNYLHAKGRALKIPIWSTEKQFGPTQGTPQDFTAPCPSPPTPSLGTPSPRPSPAQRRQAEDENDSVLRQRLAEVQPTTHRPPGVASDAPGFQFSLWGPKRVGTNTELEASSHSTPNSPPPSSPLPSEVLAKGPTRWRLGAAIGQGSFGQVFRGLNEDSGELFAVKRVPVDDESAEEGRRISREISLLQSAEHPHVVRYLGSEVGDGVLFIFMEYVSGGSLSHILAQFGTLEEDLIRRYSRQLLLGLAYLHRRGIVHRDIKGANVLLDHHGVVKLADFGCSRQLHGLRSMSLEESLTALPGSVPWMAPEVIKRTGFGKPSDIWSVGATMVEMATATRPWPDLTNNLAAVFAIASATEPPVLPEGLSPQCQITIASCMRIDSTLRPRAEELLEGEFLRAEGRE